MVARTFVAGWSAVPIADNSTRPAGVGRHSERTVLAHLTGFSGYLSVPVECLYALCMPLHAMVEYGKHVTQLPARSAHWARDRVADHLDAGHSADGWLALRDGSTWSLRPIG